MRADGEQSSFVPLTSIEQADEMIRRELLTLMEHENAKYPLDEKVTKEKKKGAKRAINGSDVPVIEYFEEDEMKDNTRHVVMIGKKWSIPVPGNWKPLTTKASNRAAVHGVKPPVPDIIDKEQVEKDIEMAKQEKEAKRKQIEETIDSHINNSSKSQSSSAH